MRYIDGHVVRPEFTDTLAIKLGRHPILCHAQDHYVVGNDTFASQSSRLQIITGPNASGKSTYLNQIALLVIMGHMGLFHFIPGCFIPCQYASIRITDKILSRIGRDNGIEANASSFIIEMRETLFILDQVTDSSLVIIDELGRGIYYF